LGYCFSYNQGPKRLIILMQTHLYSTRWIRILILLISGLFLVSCAPLPAQALLSANPPTPILMVSASSTAAKAVQTVRPPDAQSAVSSPSAAQAAAPTSSATPTRTPTPASTTVAAGRVAVPILLYHHISDQGKGRYDLPLKDFRAQMQALADGGYQTLTISRLADVIRSGGSLPDKPVVITFDDGYLDTYQNALPVLQEHGFSGVAYIITQTQQKEKSYGYMQVDQLKALIAAGWEIGSHSISHSSLKTTHLGMRNEIEKSKQDLETELGVPVRSFSYPFGIANPWIMDRVQEYGYDSAVGLDIFVNQTPRRLYYLSRREVQRGITQPEFLALLTPGEEEKTWLQAITQTPNPAAP
jgi:peptidoglycan/xylan/chitin deacetylase (PgdA/CDA1 family)